LSHAVTTVIGLYSVNIRFYLTNRETDQPKTSIKKGQQESPCQRDKMDKQREPKLKTSTSGHNNK
jgi:hypothetical protein